MIENDGLPSQICLQCVHYINSAFSFKQLCERSDSTLRQLLGKPMHATFLELKPIATNETTETTFSDVIESVTGSMESVTHSVPDVLDDPLDSCSVADESFKCEDEDLKLKLEEFSNSLGSE